MCCANPKLDITHTHTHPFKGPLSRTTWVSRYQKGKTNLDFTEARDSEWQWHQLGHMQVCTSLQIDNQANTSPLSFYRPDALPAAQPTASKQWRHQKKTGYQLRHIIYTGKSTFQTSCFQSKLLHRCFRDTSRRVTLFIWTISIHRPNSSLHLRVRALGHVALCVLCDAICLAT